MNKPNMEQLAAAQQANAEVMMALLRTAFNGAERLAALNMAASRDLFNNTVANAQQLLGAKDAAEVAKLGSDLGKPNVDKWWPMGLIVLGVALYFTPDGEQKKS